MSLLTSIFGDSNNNDATTEVTTKKKKITKKEDTSKNAALASLFSAPPVVPPKPKLEQTTVTTKEDAKSDKKKTKKSSSSSSDSDDESSGSGSGSDDDSSSNGSSSSNSSSDDDSSSSSEGDDDNYNKNDDNKKNDEAKIEQAETTTEEKTTQVITEDHEKKNSSSSEKKLKNGKKAKQKKENPISEKKRTIFVGNLPLSTTRRSLEKIFASCGKIESSRLRSVATAGKKLSKENGGQEYVVDQVCINKRQFDTENKHCMNGYVVFESLDALPKALKLNNTELSGYDIETKDSDGNVSKTGGGIRRIRVDTAQPTLFDTSRSVYVSNLPHTADEESLSEHFVKACGIDRTDIQGVRLIRDKETSKCKGFGYVLFQDRTGVALALREMRAPTEYLGRKINVNPCGKQDQIQKKKERHRNRIEAQQEEEFQQEQSRERRDFQPYQEKNSKSQQQNAYLQYWSKQPNDKNKRWHTNNDTNDRDNKKRWNNDNTYNNNNNPAPKKRKFEGQRATTGNHLSAQKIQRKVKKNKTGSAAAITNGISKRAAKQQKVEKRVKQIQKRISKGMGKGRKY